MALDQMDQLLCNTWKMRNTDYRGARRATPTSPTNLRPSLIFGTKSSLQQSVDLGQGSIFCVEFGLINN